jgi:hypothetical protein
MHQSSRRLQTSLQTEGETMNKKREPTPMARAVKAERRLKHAEQKIEALEGQVAGLLRQRELIKEILR